MDHKKRETKKKEQEMSNQSLCLSHTYVVGEEKFLSTLLGSAAGLRSKLR